MHEPRRAFASSRSLAWLAVVILLALLGEAPANMLPRQEVGSPATAVATEEPLLARVAVIGASASAGFSIASGDGPVTLARVLEQMVPGEAPVEDLATSLFFIAPKWSGRSMVDRAREHRPTLVFALDFLFWYGYGTKGSEKERLVDLNEGLRLLEGFECPVLLGTLPDMHAAIGTMLHASQVPGADRLERMNRRIEDWAATRPRVILVPIVAFLEDVRQGRPAHVGKTVWPAGSKPKLLQHDELHPTATGLVALAQVSLEAAGRAIKGFDARPFTRLDAAALAARLSVAAPTSTKPASTKPTSTKPSSTPTPSGSKQPTPPSPPGK